MESNNPNYVYDSVVQLDDSATASRKYLAKVFTWMFVALGISAFVAFEFFLTPSLMSLDHFPTPLRLQGFLQALGYVAIICPSCVFTGSQIWAYNRIYLPSALWLAIFIAYAAVTGISLSFSAFSIIRRIFNVTGVFLTSCFTIWCYGSCRLYNSQRPNKNGIDC